MKEVTSRDAILADALKRVRGWFWSIGCFSTAINLLMLTGSLYMLQMYDRVLAAKSVPTLLALSGLALIAYTVQGWLESIRTRMLVHIGADYEAALSPAVYDAVSGLALKGVSSAEAAQPMRDLERIRVFLSGLGPTALLDMPFMPLFLAGCFILHPALGLLALGGGAAIIGLTLLVDLLSRRYAKSATLASQERAALLEASCRNAEAMTAMGFRRAMRHRWLAINDRAQNESAALSGLTAGVGAWAKILRLTLQSAMLGLGGYLAIHQEVSAGVIIAASIMMSRALAPIELAIGHWKPFVAARESHFRLGKLLKAGDVGRGTVSLPRPSQHLFVERLSVLAPDTGRPIIQAVDFALPAGSAMAVFGPSASGKSTLARALVGVWGPHAGHVRLDGAALEQYPEDDIGTLVGYLPQDVELFDGTVAENIARFDPAAKSSEVVDAAIKAGAHEMIVNLPNGYETRIGEAGTRLSGGQRQRIALARALFRDPFLVVLDEPNSNLDGSGDQALNEAIFSVRNRGGIVVVVTHRTATLNAVDHIALLRDGRLQEFGSKQDMMPRLFKPQAPRIERSEERPPQITGEAPNAAAG